MKLPCVDRFTQAPVARSSSQSEKALVFQRKALSKNDLYRRVSKSGLKAFFIGEPCLKSSLS